MSEPPLRFREIADLPNLPPSRLDRVGHYVICISVNFKTARVVCPKFRHPAQTFTCQVKIIILARKIFFFSRIVNELLVLKLFQLSNGDFIFRSMSTASRNSWRCV